MPALPVTKEINILISIQERLHAFWAGERPDEIPYTIYQWEQQAAKDDPRWQPMFDDGLGVVSHLSAFRSHTPGLEVVYTDYEENGDKVRRETQKTPVGEIYQTWVNGWHHRYLVQAPEDYRVMEWIARNTVFEPDYERYEANIAALPRWGVPLSCVGRTPLQTMLVDNAGIEHFAYHLFEYEEEILSLYEAMLENFRRIVHLVAGAPGRFVSNLENFTAESLGPKRYEKFLLPVYEECFPVLHQAGKIVGSHYDGRTKSCRELIARAPIDLIESLTEPNEGDQTLAEARAVWPEKLFWCNIRVGDYQLPPAKLRERVLGMVAAGAPDGKRLAFEVSEHLPKNWMDSMPVVLQALHETRY